MFRDFLCSLKSSGPWLSVRAVGFEEAVAQFAREEDLRMGDIVYVGVPAPIPLVFTGDSLAQHIAERLGIPVSPELAKVASGLAGEANIRLDQFAAERSAEIGRASEVRPMAVRERTAYAIA